MGKAFASFKISSRERLIAVLTVCRFWGAKYPWGAQSRNAVAQGVEQSIIDAINAGKTPDLSNPREAMAHKLPKELLTNKGLSEATYQRGREALRHRRPRRPDRQRRAILDGVLQRQRLRHHADRGDAEAAMTPLTKR